MRRPPPLGAALLLTLLVGPASAQEPSRPADASAPAPLVLRNRADLTLGGAQLVLDAALAKARAQGWKMNIAVVDDGGHLLSFARMDGARPASGTTAITKATAAATFRAPTGPLPAGAAEPDLLLNLALQNAAAASGGKVTSLLGGVPIVLDGQVIGAVGVGGGSGEQDAEVARAGIAALLEALPTGSKPCASDRLRRPRPRRRACGPRGRHARRPRRCG